MRLSIEVRNVARAEARDGPAMGLVGAEGGWRELTGGSEARRGADGVSEVDSVGET